MCWTAAGSRSRVRPRRSGTTPASCATWRRRGDARRTTETPDQVSKEAPMAVSPPTPDQLKSIADAMGLALTPSDLESFAALMKPSIDGYNVVDSLPDNLPAVKYPRTPGVRPQPEENTRNAWYVKTRVEGASTGKLKGKTVVLK